MLSKSRPRASYCQYRPVLISSCDVTGAGLNIIMGLQANMARGFPFKLWGFEVKVDGVLPVTVDCRNACNSLLPVTVDCRNACNSLSFVMKMGFWNQLIS
jgi:hypothetical protein